MSKLIINTIVLIYGDGLASKCNEWMSKIWDAITEIFANGLVDNAYTAFSAVSASLLLLYFLMDMTTQASRELLTLEKFTLMGIKYVVAIVILLNINDITNGIVTIGKSIYNTALNVTFTNITGEGMGSYSSFKAAYSSDDAAKEAMVSIYEGNLPSDVIDKFGALAGDVVSCFFPYLIGFLCQMVSMLIVTTNALNICIRGFFIPLAIPQLFEDGMRSAGVRYIKSFAAYCLEMAVIVITLRFSSHLANYIQSHLYAWECQIFTMVDGVTVFNADKVDDVLSADKLIPALIPMVAAMTGIAGSSKLTHEITGA